MIRLDDKVAVVTGASRGIGAEIARTFARAGARVVIASRKQEGLDAEAAVIREAGGEVTPLTCHTGKPDQVAALVQGALDQYGQIDVLVNNAATNPHFGPMLTAEHAAWAKTFEVNLEGPFNLIRAVVKHLQERSSPGSIINVSSILGSHGAPFQGIYGMTKAALISMTRTLAIELGSDGIRVNALAPGMVETRFSQALTSNPELASMIVQRTPADRFGTPEDIAGAALYLASDAAKFVTGSVFTVDGGLTAGAI